MQARVCNAETCPKRGCTDLSLPTKIRFYNNYHNITYDEQSALLKSLMKISEVGRRRDCRNDATSRRTCTFKYTIDDLEVCRLTFIDTFQITKRRVETIQNKIKNNIDTPIDGRGKHRNRPHAIPNLVRRMIRQHIDSFPRQLSHYSRKNSEKECLSPDLSLSKMYSLFIELNPDVKASKTLYEEVFTKEFNLRFGVPRSDTCKYCDMNYIKLISAKTEEERKNIEIQSNLHHSKADQAYKQLKQDADIARKNKNIIVLCVDLQQVLFCPNLTHSSIFYQRQLSNYNFAIHDMGSNDVTMCLWHECQAKRGSTEIASCILKYVVDRFTIMQPGEQRKLIIWSDRCVGQNNNWRVLNLYALLVQSRYFSEINQKFLCSGHSFLPCDRDFALIEKKKKIQRCSFLEIGSILSLRQG